MKTESRDVLSQLVLGEIAGKNAANHAYDKILWQIRSGYLTLVFVGWSVLLKAIAEANLDNARGLRLTLGLVLVTIGLAIGGWFIDRGYLRRKFRVILAQNDLVNAIKESPESLANVPVQLLTVSGDNGEARFASVGYAENLRAATAVYFVPLFAIIAAVIVLIA